ncbi:MAG: RNA polymerase sigma factor, partial [Planctomycetota bacterium]
MNEQSDLELVEAAKRGDSRAVADLYRRYWRAARAVAYGVTADFSSAEDAAAEGLQAALTSLHKLKSPQSLGPWLRTIVVRAAGRQRSREANWEDVTALPEEASTQDRLERRELALLVREAVDRLPPQLREAIALHYFEGYPVAEGARFLGIPAGTLKRRLHDGRRRLKDTCTAIVQGRKPMEPDRARLAERIDALLAEGADQATFFELAKEVMQVRPFPRDLMHKLAKSHLGSQLGGERWEKTQGRVLQALREHGGPSARTADPNHPVGRATSAIIEALPHFQRLEVAPEEIIGMLVARYGPNSPPEPEPFLPPGFAEGRSVAYLRLASGLVIVDERGRMKDMRELMHENISRKVVNSRFDQGARLSDVIDLTWMETRPLELRDVELQLRELAGKVAAGPAVRFSAYEAPCYRAALRMH